MTLSNEFVFIKIKITILRPLRYTYLLKTAMLLQLLHTLALGGFYLQKNATVAAMVFSYKYINK